MLPHIALAVILIAAAWASEVQRAGASKSGPQRNSRALRGVLGAIVAWAALQAMLVWPHAMPHVNALWGGSTDGYRLVTMSNYDWGQGIPQLAQWREQNAQRQLIVWYFGNDHHVHNFNAQVWTEERRFSSEAAFLRRVQGHYVAVGTTILYGAQGEANCNEHRCNPGVAVLRRLQPVDRTATFLIYDFTSPESR